MDAGKLDLEYLDFDLRQMLDDFVDSIALKAEEKGLEIVLDSTGIQESMVNGDPGRLRQILTNLVGNSIKFTEEGLISIFCSLSENMEGYAFEVMVADTGIGIPADKISHLFEAFTQLDASTTRKYGGTGLGLAICQRLCLMMGGTISAESNEGEGSRFTFTIQLRRSTHTKAPAPKVNLRDISVLIVDDNHVNREVLKKQLELWGANVTDESCARDTLHTLSILADNPDSRYPLFDVAILDMHMPSISGADLGKMLKSDPRYEDIPLVMMTSMSHRGDARYFADIGFAAYFPKPCTLSDLKVALSVVKEKGDALNQADPLVTRHYVQSLTPSHNTNIMQENKTNQWPEETRLLLVEDNAFNQEVALMILEEIGLTADVAGNGVEALAALKTADDLQPYTLVLMDCQMPDMDGYEASQEIRKGNAGEDNIAIPIIAMTANAMKGDKQKCLDAGMSDYLTKPVDADELAAILAKWLHKLPISVTNSQPPQD